MLSHGESRSPLQREIDFELTRRVKAGIARLREEFGDDSWVDRIDPNELMLEDANACVLGQVYAKEAAEIGSDGFHVGLDHLDCVSYMFGFSTEEHNYDDLTEVWRREIVAIQKS